MSGQPPPPQFPNTSNVGEFIDEPNINVRIADLQRARRVELGVDTEVVDNFEDEFEYGSLIGTMRTAINGSDDVPEQKIQVMYLTRDNQLLIPQALGVSITNPALSEALHEDLMITRYWKLAARTYQELYDIVMANSSIATKREALDAFAIPNPLPVRAHWDMEHYAMRGANNEDDERRVSFVFAIISKTLKLNCDIRDVGALVGAKEDMRLGDMDWARDINPVPGRLQSKLKAYSMNCIAALNMAACGNWAIGAWVRSYGISCGILPVRATRLNKEWRYVKAAPTQANLTEVVNANNVVGSQLHSLCLNMLAMFGLMHLNKNHTFITGDANMLGICTAYINTLRTMVNTTIIDQIKANMEVACRTAAHPFGLGQTYWLARYMDVINALAAALALRTTVTPPLTQRLMIVQTAVREWDALPIGKSMRKIYGCHIDRVLASIDQVKACPPLYSELAEIYGLEQMQPVPEDAKVSANALMPIIHGYAEVLHIDENQNRDGLAQALSLGNVQRDNAVQTRVYHTLWEKYIQSIDKSGLEEFMRTAMELEKMGS